MSVQVDERVVSMKFDNKQFEKNVSTSMNTLDKLKKSLDLEGAAKGLEKVESASNKVQLSSVSRSAEAVANKFSALDVIGVTALANITNAAVNAGTQLLKSLSIDQVTAGWQKFNETGSFTQTIMNSTGEDLDTVSGYLDKLMWFSDETSFSFTEMTGALATMTSSGGEVEDLIPLIEGVANATAFAGKGAAEFSRMMYNVNQSYGRGFIDLTDWRSLEEAGVASTALKQTMIDTAVAMGKISEGEIDIGSFSSTLADKWLDKEVMEAGFGEFSAMTEEAYELIQKGIYENASEAYAALEDEYGEVAVLAAKAAQEYKTWADVVTATKDAVSTGWMRTFEYIFGNFEEQKALWSDVGALMYDVFAASAEARNEVLAEWKEAGGRDDLIESFWNIVEAISAIVGPIKEAWNEIFPPMTAERLLKITETIKNFTSQLIISDERGENVKKTFQGLFAVLDIITTVVGKVLSGLGRLIGVLFKMDVGLDDASGGIGEFLLGLRDALKSTDAFDKVIDSIVGGFAKFIEWIESGVGSLKDFVSRLDISFDLLGGITSVFGTLYGWISSVVNAIGSFIKSIGTLIKESKIFQNIFGGIGSLIENVVGFISNFFTKASGGIDTSRWITFQDIVMGIWNALKGLGDLVVEVVSVIVDAIAGLIGDGSLKELLSTVNSGIFSAMLLSLAGALNKFATPFEAFTGLFDGITEVFDAVKQKLGDLTDSLRPDVIGNIAKAILVLAIALLVISSIDADELSRSLSAVAILFAELLGSMTIMTKIGDISNLKVTSAMIGLAAAVLILAIALKKIASVNEDDLIKSITVLGTALAMLVASMRILSKGGGVIVKGFWTFMGISAALVIMASTLKSLAKMEWDDLSKGIIAMGTALGMMLLVIRSLKTPADKAIKGAGQLILIALTLNMLVVPLTLLGLLPWENLLKGIGGLSAILLALTFSFKIINKVGNGVADTIKSTTSLLIMATALTLLAAPLVVLGLIPWLSLVQGVLGLSVILVALNITFKVLSKIDNNAKSTITSATSLVIMASALLLITAPLALIGLIPWENLARGLVGITIALAALTVAFAFINKTAGSASTALASATALVIMSTSLIILAGALSLIGNLSWEQIIKGLFGIVGVLGVMVLISTMLSGALAGAAGIAILSASLFVTAGALLMLSAALAALALVPYNPVIMGLIKLAGAIALLSIASILSPLLLIMSSAMLLFTAATLGMGIGLINLALGITMLSAVVGSLQTVIIGVLTAFTASATAFFALIKTLLVGFLQMLIDIIPVAVQTVVTLGVSILNGLSELVGPLVDLAKTTILAVLAAVDEVLPNLMDVIFNFLDLLLDKLLEFSPKLFDVVLEIIVNLIDAIAKKVPEIVTSLVNLVLGIIDGIADNLVRIINAGFELIIKFIDGIDAAIENYLPVIISKIITLAGTLVEALAKGLGEGLSNIAEVGKNLMSGLLNGLKNGLTNIWEGIKSVGKSVLDGLKDVLGIHSPSKETFAMGEFLDQGLINGLEKLSGSVKKSAEGVGTTAMKGLSNTLSNVADIINSDIETQPTIRPVLDLSNIRAGARSIGDIFGVNPSVGVLANVGSISTSMNNVQNGDNEVLAAIRDLGSKIGSVRGDTYNINGISYDDGSSVAAAVETLIRAIRIEGRV